MILSRRRCRCHTFTICQKHPKCKSLSRFFFFLSLLSTHFNLNWFTQIPKNGYRPNWNRIYDKAFSYNCRTHRHHKIKPHRIRKNFSEKYLLSSSRHILDIVCPISLSFLVHIRTRSCSFAFALSRCHWEANVYQMQKCIRKLFIYLANVSFSLCNGLGVFLYISFISFLKPDTFFTIFWACSLYSLALLRFYPHPLRYPSFSLYLTKFLSFSFAIIWCFRYNHTLFSFFQG